MKCNGGKSGIVWIFTLQNASYKAEIGNIWTQVVHHWHKCSYSQVMRCG